MVAFWIILTAAIVAVTCSLLGCFLVLGQKTMIADAISHAILPGIFFAFILTGERGGFFTLIGAASFGLFATFLIEFFQQKLKIQSDAAIGLIFSFLFAVGVILISAFSGQIDLDQDCVLYGEIAYVPLDIWILPNGMYMGPYAVWRGLAVLLIIISFITIGYKGLFLTTFDENYAKTIYAHTYRWRYALMAAVSLCAVAAFDSVGAVLVVTFFIGPAAIAYLMTNKLKVMLLLSAVIGVIIAILGYYLAVLLNGSIAGAMATVTGLLFAIVFVYQIIIKSKKEIHVNF